MSGGFRRMHRHHVWSPNLGEFHIDGRCGKTRLKRGRSILYGYVNVIEVFLLPGDIRHCSLYGSSFLPRLYICSAICSTCNDELKWKWKYSRQFYGTLSVSVHCVHVWKDKKDESDAYLERQEWTIHTYFMLNTLKRQCSAALSLTNSKSNIKSSKYLHVRRGIERSWLLK